jgi:cell shape-determining protein MreC
LQVEQVTTHFETKFRELEEFERNFAELKAEKSNLNQYHNEIERMKLEGDRLTDELRQR